MVFQSLITFPSAFRNTTGVYFIDNVASLMALVNGRSDRPEFDIIAQRINLLLFCRQCSLWLEWIPSKSNWSDASSCKGFLDSPGLPLMLLCLRQRSSSFVMGL